LLDPGVRGDPTFNEASGSSTGRFERRERGDPTSGDLRDDATTASAPAATRAPAGTLRTSAALPRRRGLAGDIRYLGTVVLGLRTARRELAELAARQATRQHSRRHHLVTLGRAAVAGDRLERRAEHPLDQHPALVPARDHLAAVEDERSQHAGHVIAADSELTRVRRDREASTKQYVADLAALDAELAGLVKKLEPLHKQAIGARKRAVDLHDALRRIDDKIAATDACLAAIQRGQGGKRDRADVQTELATLKADRKAIQADEPAIAAELDSLDPRIAALEAARADAERTRAEAERAEQDDQRRVEELLVAIGAKRKVVDRAAADAEARRDKILFQLGERLYVDRPDDLTAELAPIDEIDAELGLADRRMMELREVLTSVDRWKLARGIAMMVLLVGGLGALAGWLVYRFA
jgi:chromosome segregation ATPase